MSIIEQAIERLGQLKRSGYDAAVPGLKEQISGEVPVRDTPKETQRAVRAVSAPAEPVRGADVSRRIDIDLARIAEIGMVSPENPRSRVAEEFRVIKRPLIANATGKGAVPVEQGNLIMITSALPGEGKSFSAINLAISIAMELDSTVLLVDADVARPSMLNMLGLPPMSGLMDVLTGEIADLSEVLLKTNIEGLTLLPAGSPHKRATEWLASDAMNRLLADMATRYPDRIVVFDSPPLLVTTESRALAMHMGQIVLVVESGRTAHVTVKQAVSMIEACPVKMTMLNKSSARGAGSYYGYGGYASYGGYGGYGYGQSSESSQSR